MVTIKGKVPGTDIKAKVWRELSGYDPLEGDKFDFDGCVAKIALVYGVDPDDVVEELDLAAVFPTFLECIAHVNSLVLSRLDKMPKNVENGQ